LVFFVSISTASGGDVAWNPAINLSAAGQNADAPQVTMDESGHAITVWYRYNFSDYIIQGVSSSDYGVSWSAPVNVGQEGDSPQVTMDEKGNAVAVWDWHDGSDWIIQAVTSSDYGVSWSMPVNLSAAGQDAYAPQVTMDEKGNAVAVWNRYDGSDQRIQASASSDYGVSWSAPVNLTAAGEPALAPQVTMDEKGNAVAVWYGSDGSHWIIQAAASSDHGVSWFIPVNLSEAGEHAYDPQVAMDESGHAVAVWYRLDGLKRIIQAAASSDYGDSWSAPVNAAEDGVDPQVTIDESGHAVAVWRWYGGPDPIVQAVTSSDHGVSWSMPVNLSAAGQNADAPQVTMDETGHAIAVWERYDGLNQRVQASAVADTDGDGTSDILDECPEDVNKIAPGECGCGVADTDSDGDGTPDCLDDDTDSGSNGADTGGSGSSGDDDGNGGGGGGGGGTCFIGASANSLGY